jgi:predicted nucleotide-binding protein
MARRTTYQPPQFTPKQLSLSDIESGIRKLNKRISEVEQLDPRALANSDPTGKKVERSIRDAVAEIFGEGSIEAQDFAQPQFLQGPLYRGGADYTQNYENGIKKMLVDLQGLIEKLEERREDLMTHAPTATPPISTVEERRLFTREVFILHGHDDAAKQEVARFLEHLGLEPVILHEQTNRGSITIIEKLERHSNVPFAVVLLTPDDVGAPASARDNLKYRARQNVILELGYFLAKLGRERVYPLYKEGVEIPSDFSGIIYTPLDSHGGWKLVLAMELKEVWPDIDLNNVRRR